jgi:addiction module HigA family antidote
MMMFNPAHPGEVVKERLGSLSISEAAVHLGVSRVTLSRLVNGKAGVSAEMALRLAEAFDTSPDLWLKLQMNYDLWHASRKRRPKISPLKIEAA